MGWDSRRVFARPPEPVEDLLDCSCLTVHAPGFPLGKPPDIATVRNLRYARSPRVPGLATLGASESMGGTFGEQHDISNVVLLSYLAVRVDCRRAGTCGMPLTRILLSWRRLLAPAATVAEVQRSRRRGPDPHGDPVSPPRSYERAGAKVFTLYNFQPSIGRSTPQGHGMPLTCLDPGRETVPKVVALVFQEGQMGAVERSRRGVPKLPRISERLSRRGSALAAVQCNQVADIRQRCSESEICDP
jgi:hypothetical protein